MGQNIKAAVLSIQMLPVFSVRLMAKAERAALLESAAVLRKMHDLDAKEDALQVERAS